MEPGRPGWVSTCLTHDEKVAINERLHAQANQAAAIHGH
jgi:hypothetical protein